MLVKISEAITIFWTERERERCYLVIKIARNFIIFTENLSHFFLVFNEVVGKIQWRNLPLTREQKV